MSFAFFCGLAIFWGFSEALFFFIVPDVLVSFIVLKKGFQTGLKISGAAVTGAVIGGVSNYFITQYNPPDMFAFLDSLPGISPALISSVGAQIQEWGMWSLTIGAFSGTPYKIYAAQAAVLHYPIWLFVLISIPARLARLFCVCVLVHYLKKILRLSARAQVGVWVVFWISFYIFYFWAMSA